MDKPRAIGQDLPPHCSRLCTGRHTRASVRRCSAPTVVLPLMLGRMCTLPLAQWVHGLSEGTMKTTQSLGSYCVSNRWDIWANIFAINLQTESDRTENDRARAESGDVSRASNGIGCGGAAFALLPTLLLQGTSIIEVQLTNFSAWTVTA